MEQPHTLDTKNQPDTWMPLALALARVTRRLKLYAKINKEPEQQESYSAYDRYIETRLKEFAALERRYGK